MFNIILSAEKHASLSTVLGDSLVIFISFVVLLFILKKFAIVPVLAMIEKRQQIITSEIDAAQSAKEMAKQHEKEAKEVVSQAQEKAQELVLKAKETGEKIKEEASKVARYEAIQVREAAQQAMVVEKEAMLADLTQQVANLSVELSSRILKREITQEDHKRLIDEFIEGLE